METSGKVQTNTEYESYFWVKWEQVGNQDVANNRTQIKWTCGLYSTKKFYKNAIKMSAFSINGTKVYSGGTYSNFTAEGDQTIATDTLWIGHNTDGSKTFSISSFTGWLYSNHNYSCSGGSYSLPSIPRKATITEASDFKDTDNPSIKVSNPGGFKMDVWLEPNPNGDHLCERTGITLTATGQYIWDLTPEEREALRSKCPGKDCTIRLGLCSYVGNTKYTDYKDKKFIMTENSYTKPSVTVTVKLNNGSLLSQFDGMYIQGKSRVDVTLKPSAKYGANISSYSSKVDGKMYYNELNFTSDAIQNSGSVKVIGYATDSREISGSEEKTINVIEYSKPLVIPHSSENAILCYRSDGNGKRVGNSTSVWVKAKRFYYNLSQKNTCALQYRVKGAAEVWNDSVHKFKDLIPKSGTGDEYDSLIPGEVFDLKTAYTVQLMAKDDIGEFDIKTFEIPTQDVALHLGKGGKKVAVGTYCTDLDDYTFYSEWKAIFGGGVMIGDQTLKEYIKDVINGGG